MRVLLFAICLLPIAGCLGGDDASDAPQPAETEPTRDAGALAPDEEALQTTGSFGWLASTGLPEVWIEAGIMEGNAHGFEVLDGYTGATIAAEWDCATGICPINILVYRADDLTVLPPAAPHQTGSGDGSATFDATDLTPGEWILVFDPDSPTNQMVSGIVTTSLFESPPNLL